MSFHLLPRKRGRCCSSLCAHATDPSSPVTLLAPLATLLFLDALRPQGLCTCCSLCLEAHSPASLPCLIQIPTLRSPSQVGFP